MAGKNGNVKKKQPLLKRVTAKIAKKLLEGEGRGTTMGTQYKQIKDLGLMDDDDRNAGWQKKMDEDHNY